MDEINTVRKSKSMPAFDGIVGRSKPVRDVFWKIKLAAENDITVLITGDSGTGKELVAHSIHQRSNRSQGPFIPVNMGSLATELVPSELFGHEKGAFTGATELKDGMFESASGGTLFLDEISTIDAKTQTSLLRILENREFHKVGGKKIITTDARIIAATNRNLHDAVEKGTFRRDLLYRLDVFTIHLPPLRERWQDIPSLVNHFISLFNQEMGKSLQKMTQDALGCLVEYEWPGNIRELKNIVQRSMLYSNGNTVTAEDLPERIVHNAHKHKEFNLALGLPLKEIEKRYIERILWWTHGNKIKAAKILGITRKTLYNKINEYNP